MLPTFLIAFFGLTSWVLFVLFVPYFLPTIIAVLGKKTNAGGVFAVNLLLGWTLIGWIIALVWALASDSNVHSSTVIVNNAPPAPNPTPTYEYKGVQLNQKMARAAAPAGAAAQSAQPDKFDQLRKLKQLLDEGALTEEEFNQQKAILLA